MGTIDNKEIIEAIKKQYEALLIEDRKADEDRVIRHTRIKALKDALDGFSVLTTSVNKESIPTPKVGLSHFDYPAGKGWEERIKAYMKFTNKAVKISEMVDTFIKYHSDYTTAKLKAALNNAVQTMIKKGVLQVYEPKLKQKGFFYANPMWFEGKELKEEYIPILNKNLEW